MTKSLIAVFAILAMVNLASCQITLIGNCTAVEVVKDLDMAKFSGTWYEASKYYYYFSLAAKCVKETFTAKPDGTFAVQRQQNRFLQNEQVNGTARVLSPGRLSVYFPTYTFSATATYQILGTDYLTYAVIYVCESAPPNYTNRKYVWILSRDRNATKAAIEAGKTVLTKNNIPLIWLLDTDQKDCTN